MFGIKQIKGECEEKPDLLTADIRKSIHNEKKAVNISLECKKMCIFAPKVGGIMCLVRQKVGMKMCLYV